MYFEQIGNVIWSLRIDSVLEGKGIAIIEKGSTFGGGELSSYGIRSNTSAKGFLRLMKILKKKPEENEEE